MKKLEAPLKKPFPQQGMVQILKMYEAKVLPNSIVMNKNESFSYFSVFSVISSVLSPFSLLAVRTSTRFQSA